MLKSEMDEKYQLWANFMWKWPLVENRMTNKLNKTLFFLSSSIKSQMQTCFLMLISELAPPHQLFSFKWQSDGDAEN